MEQTAALDFNLVRRWEDEMGRAVDRREALPAAAREAVCRVLECVLQEELLGARGTGEVQAAIALLRSGS